MATAPATPSLMQAAAPRAARLAYAGLAPFVLGAILVWLVHAEALPLAAQALSAWAALVASFLGGIHWGLAMRDDPRQPAAGALWWWGMVWTPLAWAAVLMPAASGLVLAGAVLLAQYAADRRLYPAHGVREWLVLRFRLSVGAALCCFVAAAGT